jgi:hypothetical protein
MAGVGLNEMVVIERAKDCPLSIEHGLVIAAPEGSVGDIIQSDFGSETRFRGKSLMKLPMTWMPRQIRSKPRATSLHGAAMSDEERVLELNVFGAHRSHGCNCPVLARP